MSRLLILAVFALITFVRAADDACPISRKSMIQVEMIKQRVAPNQHHPAPMTSAFDAPNSYIAPHARSALKKIWISTRTVGCRMLR